MSAATKEIQGKEIMFVGERSIRKDPRPVVLPPKTKKPWGKVKKKVGAAAIPMRDFYDDEDNVGKLWAPGTEVEAEKWRVHWRLLCCAC